MAEAWECDGRVFDSREAAEEYAAKLADPPPVHPVGRARSGGAGCGTVGMILVAGALVVAGFSALGQVEVSGVVVLLVAAVVSWRADSRIRELRAQVRTLERQKEALQQEVWDLESQL